MNNDEYITYYEEVDPYIHYVMNTEKLDEFNRNEYKKFLKNLFTINRIDQILKGNINE